MVKKEEVFRVELRMKAKEGKAAQIEAALSKLLDPKKRFKPIPDVFYLAIKEDHVAVSTSQLGDQVSVAITPGTKFLGKASSFLQTLQQIGFGDVSSQGINFEAVASSSKSFLQKFLTMASFEDKYFFPHLLEASTLRMTSDKSPKNMKHIDDFIDKLMSTRSLFHFSAFDHIDADVEVDLDSLQLVKDVYLFNLIETVFGEVVRYFNTYTEKQSKQMLKLMNILSENALPEFEFVLTVAELGKLSFSMKGEGLFELLEFLSLHPLPTELTALSRYYDSWTSRFSNTKQPPKFG